MDLYTPLALVTGFMIGGYIGYNYCYNKLINELADMVTESIEFLNHEIVENQHYLYREEDNSFASQGDTIEQAATNYSLNSRGIIGHVKKTPLKVEFFIIDGKIEQVTD
jgi:hypothetical protein